MGGLVTKIFLCSVLVQILTRAAWVALMALLAEPHPGAGRALQQVLPLYAELAATTLEQGGPAALGRLTTRLAAQQGLRLTLLAGTADCIGRTGDKGPVLAAAVVHGDTRYCLLGESAASRGHPWHWGDAMLLVELALCGAFSFFLARYLLLPIRKLSNAAQALGHGDLTARAGPKLGRRCDEAGELVRQFDRMADRIALLITAQQRFIGDVSHEIKSPLARISMALGLARREAGPGASPRFDRMEREIEVISDLISELLTLSSLQAGDPVRSFEPFDLVALIQAVIDDAAFERPDRPVRLSAPGALAITADAVLLRRAIENVLRNALFYTQPGTAVDVAVDRMAEGGVCINVRDQGPGVPDDALPHLFDPFYRVDEARARNTGGIGIGLAICDRAVRLHGGKVSACNMRPSGLAIQLMLPAALVRPGWTGLAAAAPAWMPPALERLP